MLSQGADAAENMDGWNSGPEHAKHPIIFVETAVEKAMN
jgi:hypothetical protein